MNIKDTTYLESATCRGYALHTYSDWGSLWVAGEEFGPSFVIQAQSFESAYEIWVDERTPIDAAEVYEAYGFDTIEEYNAVCVVANETEQYPDLVEGYTYQSNSTGTGIVNTGYYEWLELLTVEFMRDRDVSIKLAAY